MFMQTSAPETTCEADTGYPRLDRGIRCPSENCHQLLEQVFAADQLLGMFKVESKIVKL